MEVIQVYQTNPFSNDQGGGVRYVINLLSGTKQKIDNLLLLGSGGNPSVNANFQYIPITNISTGYIKFLKNLCLKLLFLDLSKYKIVHVHRAYYAIPFAILKPHLKIVCTLHGRTFSVFQGKYGSAALKLIRPIFNSIEKYALSRIDYIVPVSQDVLTNFNEKYPELLSKKKVKIIGSMVSLSEFNPIESNYLQVKLGKDNDYVLFIGRLSEVKNINFLIDAFSSGDINDKLVLVIAGDGELRDELSEYASNQISRIKFIGRVKHSDIPKLICSSKIVVLCSHHEASPTVVKESISCGTPVVSFDVGDAKDYIVNGVNGYICRRSLHEFRKAINRVSELGLDRNYVANESKRLLVKCSIDYVTSQYVEIYKELEKSNGK